MDMFDLARSSICTSAPHEPVRRTVLPKGEVSTAVFRGDPWRVNITVRPQDLFRPPLMLLCFVSTFGDVMASARSRSIRPQAYTG